MEGRGVLHRARGECRIMERWRLFCRELPFGEKCLERPKHQIDGRIDGLIDKGRVTNWAHDIIVGEGIFSYFFFPINIHRHNKSTL